MLNRNAFDLLCQKIFPFSNHDRCGIFLRIIFQRNGVILSGWLQQPPLRGLFCIIRFLDISC